MKSYFLLLKEGVKHPTRVPPYLLRKLLPGSRWGSSVETRNEFVTFRKEKGSFVQDLLTRRPEYTARLYLDVRSLQDFVDAVTSDDIDRVLEVGCGYGRLTPWIAEFATEGHAVDPNEEVLQDARTLYSDVEFRSDLAQNLTYADETFGLVVTWQTLQHIPPEEIEAAADELYRVLAPGGVLILYEYIDGVGRRYHWGRSEQEYEQMVEPLELIASRSKPVEPTFDGPSEPVRDDAAEGTYHPHARLLAFSEGSNHG